MATVKRIVCLANSRKPGGRCVAGIEVSGMKRLGWIRPVSARQQDAVNTVERQYGGGGEPCVLDILDVSLVEAKPTTYQRENWLIDPTKRWSRVGHHAWEDLPRLVDAATPLWINGHHTSSGLNDEIPLQLAQALDSSLRLVRVDTLALSVFTTTSFGRTRRRVQGRFSYHATEYRLWVTDPIYEEPYKKKTDGEYQIGESFLTVSLSEPFEDANACYKLIAAIIARPMGRRS